MTVTPPDANIKKWYVMAAYKFELKAETSLREADLEVYLPKETVYIKKPRRRPVAVERPAISTLIFVHASWAAIIDYKRRIDDRLKFRMTPLPSTAANPADKNYLTVPDAQMAAFISIWASRDTLQVSLSPLLSPTTPIGPTTPTTPNPTSQPGQPSLPSERSVLAPTGASQPSTRALPVGTPVEITAGPLTGLRATTLTPITSRSRTTRLSLPLASLLSITLTLPTASLSPIQSAPPAQSF